MGKELLSYLRSATGISLLIAPIHRLAPVLSRLLPVFTGCFQLFIVPSPVPSRLFPALYRPSPVPSRLFPALYRPSPAPFRLSPALYRPSPVPFRLSPALYRPSPVLYCPSPVLYCPSPALYRPSPVPFRLFRTLYRFPPALLLSGSALLPLSSVLSTVTSGSSSFAGVETFSLGTAAAPLLSGSSRSVTLPFFIGVYRKTQFIHIPLLQWLRCFLLLY